MSEAGRRSGSPGHGSEYGKRTHFSGLDGGETQVTDREVYTTAGNHNHSIIVFDGSGRPRAYRLDQFNKKETTVGRQGQTEKKPIDIEIASPFASRYAHCKFVWVNNRWGIVDCGGMNGTTCNGVLFKSRYIHVGDMIRIGNKKAQTPEGVLICAYNLPTVKESSDWERRLYSTSSIAKHTIHGGFSNFLGFIQSEQLFPANQYDLI